LLGQPHQVLIVPAAAGLAPVLASWSTTSSNDFALTAGKTVTGTVLDSAGVALAGAQVQLTSGGVPSSLATTAANGTFTIHDSFAAGAQVAVDVAPPAGRGLARLAATGAIDLTKPLQIRYAAQTTCNVGGASVQRAGVNQPNAEVTLVGALAGTAGTVTAGIAVNATGAIKIAATADATGKLPSTLAPRVALSAVVALAPADLAVTAVNLATTCPPAAIAAPVETTATGKTVDPAQAALGGVHVEATGVGALAGMSPVQTASTSTGAYMIALATGGHYDVRFVDPFGRAAPLVVANATAAALPATATLAPAIQASGHVGVSGGANPVVGASIQILCTGAGCTGVAAQQPIAETATDATSHYVVAVPDPGTM
jgi:hypothetical protein